MKLSAIIITKNEEDVIVDCIKSVAFADEIIVIDSGSTDKTAALAKKQGAHVVDHPFKNFADQRTFGMKQAKGDWILYIDADERVSEELRNGIERITNYELRITEYDAYRIQRKNYYLGEHEWPVIEKHVRLFKKKSLTGWRGDIHESPTVEGKIGELTGYLVHYTHRNLSDMVEKTLSWSDIEVEQLMRAHHPHMVPWRFIRIMITKFVDSYIKQGGWKVGTAGLIESIYQAYSYFIIYAKLWERQSQRSKLSN